MVADADVVIFEFSDDGSNLLMHFPIIKWGERKKKKKGNINISNQRKSWTMVCNTGLTFHSSFKMKNMKLQEGAVDWIPSHAD